MKIKNLLSLIVILLAIQYFGYSQIFCSYKGKKIDYPFPSFYSFKYYPNLYQSDKDQKIISQAQKSFKKTQKKFKCYTKHYEKYTHYKKLYNLGIKRYKKKMDKSAKKVEKYGKAFVDKCLMTYLDLDSLLTAKVYSVKAKYKIPDSISYVVDSALAEINELKQKISYYKSKSASQKGAEKYILLIEACKINSKELELKETLIGFILGDNQKRQILLKKYPKPKPQKIKPQKPKKDTTKTTQPKKDTTKTQKPKQPQIQLTLSNLKAFKLDQLVQHLTLSDSLKKQIETFKNLIATIQQLENQLYPNYNPKLTKQLTDTLPHLYWQAYNLLFNIYQNFIPKDQKTTIQNQYKTITTLHQKAITQKDTALLWSTADQLASLVIYQENIIGSKYALNPTKITLITPKLTTQKPKTPSKPTTKCLPDGRIFTYSLSNKYPKLLKETGNYYRIYVATTSRFILPQEFREYQPITYISLCKNKPLKKYYVGKYSSQQIAIQKAKQLTQNFGLTTKVVLFKNGKPYKTIATFKPTKTTTKPKKQITHIGNVSGSYYFIRIGTYSSPKTPNQLKHLKHLYYETTADGKYIYYDGPYSTYSQALQALQKLKQLGYNDAYIRKLQNGKLTTASKDYIYFGIQVGAYSKPLDNNTYSKIYGKLGAKYQIWTAQKYDKIIYYVYAGTNYQKAQKLKQQIRSMGYTDAFLIAIKNGKVVPISSVLKK